MDSWIDRGRDRGIEGRKDKRMEGIRDGGNEEWRDAREGRDGGKEIRNK